MFATLFGSHAAGSARLDPEWDVAPIDRDRVKPVRRFVRALGLAGDEPRIAARPGPAARGASARRPVARIAALLALAWLVGARGVGAQAWMHAYEDPAGSRSATDIVPVADGGLLIVDIARTAGQGEDIILRRVDADGAIVWEHVYGAAGTDRARGACATSDGGFVVAGSTLSFSTDTREDTLLWKVDASGGLEWALTLGLDNIDYALSIAAAPAGGILVGGTMTWAGEPAMRAFLLSFDEAGTLTGQRVFTTGRNQGITAQHLVALPDGALIGSSTGFSGVSNGWLARLDLSGDFVWQARYGSTARGVIVTDVAPAPGGFAVAGSTSEATGLPTDALALAVDGDGAVIWQLLLRASQWDEFYGVGATGDGRVVLAGESNSFAGTTRGLLLAEVSAAGDVLDVRSGTVHSPGRNAAATPNGGVVIGGGAQGAVSGSALVLRLPPAGTFATACLPLPPVSPVRQDPGIVAATTTFFTVDRTFSPTPVILNVSDARATVTCSACRPLECTGATVTPAAACEGTPRDLAATAGGGEGALSFAWELDGDGTADAFGASTAADLAPGTTSVSVTVSDECGVGPQSCTLTVPVVVTTSVPPREVSDVRGGAVPLRVLPGDRGIVIESLADVTAYNAYVDAIGSWYAPVPASGRCGVAAWTDNGDGTLTLDVSLPANSWVDVTASTPCAEGPTGSDSRGAVRTSSGTWTACGPYP